MTDNDRVIEYFGRHTVCIDAQCKADEVHDHCDECGESWPCEAFKVKCTVARYMLFPPFNQDTGEPLPICKSCGEAITNGQFVRGPRGIVHPGYCAV